jgi:hypothetical protein
LKRESERWLFQFFRGLVDFLDAPPTAVYGYEVDRAHDIVGDRRAVPNLCFCFDAYWYFVLGIEFPTPLGLGDLQLPGHYQIEHLLGVRKMSDGDGFNIKLPDGSEFLIDSPVKQTEFYQRMYEDLKDALSIPWTEEQKKFGFHAK